MTVKELKENLQYYDDDQEMEFTFTDEVEVESWKEDRWGNRSVEVDLKLEPTFIGGSRGSCWIDLSEVNHERAD